MLKRIQSPNNKIIIVRNIRERERITTSQDFPAYFVMFSPNIRKFIYSTLLRIKRERERIDVIIYKKNRTVMNPKVLLATHLTLVFDIIEIDIFSLFFLYSFSAPPIVPGYCPICYTDAKSTIRFIIYPLHCILSRRHDIMRTFSFEDLTFSRISYVTPRFAQLLYM